MQRQSVSMRGGGWRFSFLSTFLLYPTTTVSELLIRSQTRLCVCGGVLHKIRNNIKNNTLDSTDKFTESEGDQKSKYRVASQRSCGPRLRTRPKCRTWAALLLSALVRNFFSKKVFFPGGSSQCRDA